ncbi:MAG: ral secretion pathway protein [Patescibacteria group bacterium]|nr:ral secretion pathway protein [Patescibacteria group bacterium]
MAFYAQKQTRGFTLIELLVVIAIIGILSSVVLASLNSARTKARDTVRKSDLKQLQTALELYYNSSGSYPSTGSPNPSWRGAVSYGGYGTGASGYIPGLVPTHISVLPLDPKGSLDGYLYLSDGINYKLLSHVSPESYPSVGKPFYDPVRPTWAWMLCSGEPACSSW